MNAWSLTAAGQLPADLVVPSRSQLDRGEQAARAFEAQLVSSVLGSLEKTFASPPGQNTIAGEDNYNYMGTEALAQVLVDAGGFGIARMICAHLGPPGWSESTTPSARTAGT